MMLLQDGWTALITSARNGHALVVKCLLERGADVNASDEVVDAPQRDASPE
jgi:ankyrin repeat protein